MKDNHFRGKRKPLNMAYEIALYPASLKVFTLELF